MAQPKPIYAVILIYGVVAAATIFCFDGTGDAGDSIMHYLFARYAPTMPHLYFNHWGKPLFTMAASPFAQLGFTGMKIFNLLMTTLTLWFTFGFANSLQLKNALLVPILLIFAPLYFVLTFSGLTEPMFATMLAAGLYFFAKDKSVVATVLLSFLPFVRSEGLIICGMAALYLLSIRKWKVIPLLAAGHVMFAIAGSVFHGNLFWVVKKIPYATMSSNYGSGELWHFPRQLIYVIGVPMYILFWIGLISLTWKTIQKQVDAKASVLVLGGTLVFFAAHMLFWYLGIFKSLGLIRVLIAIMPLIAILVLVGFNALTEALIPLRGTVKRTVQGLIIAYIVIFPFTPNPAAIDWEKDLSLSNVQLVVQEVSSYIDDQGWTDRRLVHLLPYLSHLRSDNHFDVRQRIKLGPETLSQLQPGDIIVWDYWFAVTDGGISQELLDQKNDLERRQVFRCREGKKPCKMIVYEVMEDRGVAQ